MKIEFFKDRSGCFKPVLYFKFEGQVYETFDKLTPEQVEVIFSHLLGFPEAKTALLQLSKHYPGNKPAILRQFIECNWLEMDDKVDITERRLNYEYVPCPMRGANTCPYNECICMIKNYQS
jgi:hypothetical protein